MKACVVSVREAKVFVRAVHRRLPLIQGGRWAIGVEDGGQVVGVAIVGTAARMLSPQVLNVARVAVVNGFPNACSMLYGACSRAAKAMGARGLVTYLHLDEGGVSLKASGWICDGQTKGGQWSREDRQRALAIDPSPKLRWWAPWSDHVKKQADMANRPPAITGGVQGNQVQAADSLPRTPRPQGGITRSGSPVVAGLLDLAEVTE